jgi:hypothetical protein
MPVHDLTWGGIFMASRTPHLGNKHIHAHSLTVVALHSPTSWLFFLFVKSKPSFLPRIRTHNPGHVLFFSAGFLFFSFYIKRAASFFFMNDSFH